MLARPADYLVRTQLICAQTHKSFLIHVSPLHLIRDLCPQSCIKISQDQNHIMIWHGATSSGSCLQNASKPSAMAAAAFMCTCPNDKFTAPLRQTERSWLFESLNPVRNTAVSLFRSNDYSSLLSLLFPQTHVSRGVLG